jgi:hypothetical protein
MEALVAFRNNFLYTATHISDIMGLQYPQTDTVAVARCELVN